MTAVSRNTALELPNADFQVVKPGIDVFAKSVHDH